MEFSTSMYQVGSPVSAAPLLPVVQLAEDLKLALELQPHQEERESLRAQLPAETAQALLAWLQSGEVSLHRCPVVALLRVNVCIPLRSPVCRQTCCGSPNLSHFPHRGIMDF